MCWIGFAGEIYPFYDKPAKNDIDGKIIEPRQLLFGCEFINERYNSSRHVFDRLRFSFSQRNPVYNHLDAPKLIELCFSRFGPIFYIKSHENYGKPYHAIKNPKLENLGFAKVLPPHLAYNALQRYVYNQTNPEKPIPEMSNDLKIHQAGFDLKKSFRREKSKKKH